jgi:hypothetical protein
MEEVKDSAVEEIQENVVKEPQETETTSEAKEAQEAVETQAGIETPEEKNPFLDYMRNAFAKEHIDEFMSTLTDDQKSFIYVFCSGFETAIGRHIVGVYNSEYIEGYHFTKEVLDSLRIVIKPVDVKDSDLKFTIVAQLI